MPNQEIIQSIVETGGLTLAMTLLGVVTVLMLRIAVPAIQGIAVIYQNAMTAQANVLGQVQKQLDTCNDATVATRVRMDKLEDDVAQKTGRIAELEKQVSRLEKENASLREELKQKDAEMEKALKAKENEIEALKKRVAELEHPKEASKAEEEKAS